MFLKHTQARLRKGIRLIFIFQLLGRKLLSQLVYWVEQRKIPFLANLLASFWWLFTNLDIYPEHSIGKQDGECRSIFGNFIVTPIVNIPDRAKPEIMQHLQALAIPCWRTRDGNIWVEVRDVNVAVLVYNAIEQSTAKHQELVELLQHCWDVKQIGIIQYQNSFVYLLTAVDITNRSKPRLLQTRLHCK